MHNALAKGVRLARPVEAVSLAGTHLSVLLNLFFKVLCYGRKIA